MCGRSGVSTNNLVGDWRIFAASKRWSASYGATKLAKGGDQRYSSPTTRAADPLRARFAHEPHPDQVDLSTVRPPRRRSGRFGCSLLSVPCRPRLNRLLFVRQSCDAWVGHSQQDVGQELPKQDHQRPA